MALRATAPGNSKSYGFRSIRQTIAAGIKSTLIYYIFYLSPCATFPAPVFSSACKAGKNTMIIWKNAQLSMKEKMLESFPPNKQKNGYQFGDLKQVRRHSCSVGIPKHDVIVDAARKIMQPLKLERLPA